MHEKLLNMDRAFAELRVPLVKIILLMNFDP